MRALPHLHDIAIPGVATIVLPDWWYNLEDSPDFQTKANYGIGGAYAAIALIALVQLIRIHQRVPEYGWTTQKTFHLLNCIVSILRSGIFLFRPQVEALHPALVRLLLLDMPGLLFFTTYTLLVLFWAEIYHQARSLPVAYLRPSFIAMNVVIYGIEFGLWALSTLGPSDVLQQWGYTLSNAFLVAVSLLAAFGFVLYGGRLFLMLQRFPIESRGRRKKLREVGLVTTICAGCFTARAAFVALSALDLQDLQIDLLGHPLLNIAYYSLVEIFPSACVLFILRKLPPKRSTPQGYQAIPANVQQP